MTNTATIERTEEIRTNNETATRMEICLGALMGISAIAGMWGVVSLMIRFMA